MQPENVWDYPRPPRIEAVRERVRILLGGEVVADTAAGGNAQLLAAGEESLAA